MEVTDGGCISEAVPTSRGTYSLFQLKKYRLFYANITHKCHPHVKHETKK